MHSISHYRKAHVAVLGLTNLYSVKASNKNLESLTIVPFSNLLDGDNIMHFNLNVRVNSWNYPTED